MRFASVLLMAGVVVITLPGCHKVAEELSHLKKDLDVRLRGYPQPSLIFDHEFHLSVWHQHPGTISKGHVWVSVSGTGLKGEPNRGGNLDEWSFDFWEPNASAAKRLVYYVDTVKNDLSLQIRIRITSAETAPYDMTYFFSDGKWSAGHPTRTLKKTVNSKKA